MAKTLPLPCVSTAFVAKTPPCVSTVFVAKTLPLPCVSTAFVAKTLPLPCVPTAFVAKTVPFLAASQEECLSAPCRNGGACADSSTNSSVAVDELFCACSDGYSGDSCELDTDECASVRVGCL